MQVQVAKKWFEVRRVDAAITMLWEPYNEPLIKSNIWHLRGRHRDLLVDSGCGIASLRAEAGNLFSDELLAVATHTHFDHIGSHAEFRERLVHESEAEFLRDPSGENTLYAGLLSADLITALPHPGYDLMRDYAIEPAAPTRILREGDVVDTGDRAFEVLHLPGHSPGSIGLWEAATGTLFSGDAVYDGELLDQIPRADVGDYIVTMRRLLDLPVTVVHPGHRSSFGRERLVQLAEGYLRSKGA